MFEAVILSTLTEQLASSFGFSSPKGFRGGSCSVRRCRRSRDRCSSCWKVEAMLKWLSVSLDGERLIQSTALPVSDFH